MNVNFKNTITPCLLVLISVLSSCLKDEGNYEYATGQPVVIRYLSYNIPALIGQEITVIPTRTYQTSGINASDYTHEWYVNEELVSTDSTLLFTGKTSGFAYVRYYMIDKVSGLRFAAPMNTINVTSPYQQGWGILYEKNGKSEIGHIRFTAGVYYDYTDLYQHSNNGAELGSRPRRIKEYTVTNGRALAIIQSGGQGTVELDSYTNERRLVTNDAFAGTPPSGLDPLNIGFYPSSHLLLNADGKLYPRLFPVNPIPYSIPWLTLPLQIEKGMKIKDIWDTWSQSTNLALMYDELNKRVLYIRVDPTNTRGGVAIIDTLPAPPTATPYPSDHVNPSHLNDWKYIWGGTFNDGSYILDGAVLMQASTGSDMFLQSFRVSLQNGARSVTPLNRVRFTGNDLVNENSIYVAIKSRNYLFFSGDSDNRSIYYFDLQSGSACQLFERFDSQITTLRQSDNSLELAVGLENGTVIIYDISNVALASGTSNELHRLSGLGRVVDITVKGGQMR